MGLFRAAYATSNRASCKKCKEKIEKGSLRLAIMVQSYSFDGKIPKWFHYDCFWKTAKVFYVHTIQGFETLRWEDQQRLCDSLKADSNKSAAATGTDSVDSAADGDTSSGDMPTYRVQYAKSRMASCRGCSAKIDKGEVRISKKDTTSPGARRFGPQDLWHHVDCFVDDCLELGFAKDMTPESLSGFSELTKDDQRILTEKFSLRYSIHVKKNLEPDRIPSDLVSDLDSNYWQRQTDSAEDSEEEPLTKKRKKVEDTEETILKEQSKTLWQNRDALERNVKQPTIKAILEANQQFMPTGASNVLDAMADCLTFGALEKCPECPSGALKYGSSGFGYICTGNMSEWTKCIYKTKSPKRRPLVIPDSHQTADILKSYIYVEKARHFQGGNKKQQTRKLKAVAGSSNDKVDSSSDFLPLEDMKFVLAGTFKKSKSKMARQIMQFGGRVTSYIDSTVAACISTKDEVDKKSPPIAQAKRSDVHVVDEEFLDEVHKGGATLMIHQHSIAKWGSDPVTRIEAGKKPKTKYVKKTSRYHMKKFASNDKGKVRLTRESAVDPDAGITVSAHVFKQDSDVFNVVLGRVDIVTGTNAYYKIQVIENDKKSRWWVFRSWGRVGTKVGDTKLHECNSAEEAVKQFVDVYYDKTSNLWKERDSFVKHPHKFYPLDIEYGEDEDIEKVSLENSKSTLPRSVQEIVCMIFDIENMKKLMKEFEIDLKKMPLGKLSKKQLQSAYKVLTRLQKLVEESGSKNQFLDASNQFYTLIPHDCGMGNPPLLDTEEMIKNKTEMLDNLLEIEVAYSLLKGSKDGDQDDKIKAHYDNLKCILKPLDHDSEIYQTLVQCVQKTHCHTHTSYKLEVDEVEREGEREKYHPFQKLDNRMLLWHGSRVTNFAGILSQGLRIAPPEAPRTGYMFGKGVYFADMVTKSANYCHVSRDNPSGLMLLSEVYLGDMYQLKNSENIDKLPEGKNSCKGLGKTVPDPSQTVVTPEGVQIPCGEGKNNDMLWTSLHYNEYVVYDVNQINIKYLLKMKFKFN